MACPITVAKFVGTISLGLLTVRIHTLNFFLAALPCQQLSQLTQQQGVSYTVSNIAIPALQALPTAGNGATTLKDIQTRTRGRVLRFSNIAAVALITAFSMSSPRRRHPYLIWTSLFALVGGGGLEWWSTGSLKAVCCASCSPCSSSSSSNSEGSGSSCGFSVGSWLATHIGCRRNRSARDNSNNRVEEEDVLSNGAGGEIEIVEAADAQSAGASAIATPVPEEADVVDANGESVQREMVRERKLQKVRTWVFGLGFSMGIVGIWGDGA